VHVLAPVAEKVLAAQGVQEEAPPAELEPAGHRAHTPLVLANWPAGHAAPLPLPPPPPLEAGATQADAVVEPEGAV
jgi:hypothetical protein